MMTYDFSKRITASEALNHNWIKKEAEKEEDHEATLAALDNLKNFRVEQKLQQAAITFIVS